MNSAESLAKHYATALMEVAHGSECADRVIDDMRLVDECVTAEPGLFRQLGTPSFNRRNRLHLIDTVFGKSVHEVTHRFFRLLVHRNRLNLLRLIYPALCSIRDREHQVKKIVIKSAAPLPPAQREALEHRLKKRFGEHSIFSYSIKQSLIGGFSVATDGMEIDCSIQSGLSKLRKELATW